MTDRWSDTTKMEHCTTFKFSAKVTHVRSNLQSKFQVTRSKLKITRSRNVKTVFVVYLCKQEAQLLQTDSVTEYFDKSFKNTQDHLQWHT